MGNPLERLGPRPHGAGLFDDGHIQAHPALPAPFLILFSSAGSLFPDLDRRRGHRKALHNLASMLVSTASILFLTSQLGLPLFPALGFLTGYLSHLVGDMMTPRGIAILYPFRDAFYRSPLLLGRSDGFLANFFASSLGAVLIFLAVLGRA